MVVCCGSRWTLSGALVWFGKYYTSTSLLHVCILHEEGKVKCVRGRGTWRELEDKIFPWKVLPIKKEMHGYTDTCTCTSQLVRLSQDNKA